MAWYALTKKPYERLAKANPRIAKKLNKYFLSLKFHTLPRHAGLDDQWHDDMEYFTIFTQKQTEHDRTKKT